MSKSLTCTFHHQMHLLRKAYARTMVTQHCQCDTTGHATCSILTTSPSCVSVIQLYLPHHETVHRTFCNCRCCLNIQTVRCCHQSSVNSPFVPIEQSASFGQPPQVCHQNNHCNREYLEHYYCMCSPIPVSWHACPYICCSA